MGALSKQMFFKAPLEKVWDLFISVERTPEWVEGVQECTVTEKSNGAGMKWEENCYFDNLPVQMKHEMTECDPQKRAVIQTELPMGGSMNRSFEFKTSEDQTELHIQSQWDLGMASAFVGADRVQEIMESSLNATCQRWREKVES